MADNLQKLFTPEQLAWKEKYHPNESWWELIEKYLPSDFPPSRKRGAQVGRKAANKKKP